MREKKVEEKELRARTEGGGGRLLTEERCRKLFENARDIVFMMSGEGRLTLLNPAFEEISGWKAEEWIGKFFLPLVHPEDADLAMDMFQRGLKGEKLKIFEIRVRRKSQGYFTGEVLVTTAIGGKAVPEFLGIVRDVTGRKTTEATLRKTSQLLEGVFSSVDVLLAYLDPRFNFISVNKAYAEAAGKGPDFFVGKNLFSLYPHKGNEKIFRKAVRTGESCAGYERPFTCPDYPERGIFFMDWKLHPVKDDSGKVGGLVLSMTNVTQHKKTRERLVRVNRLYSLRSAVVSAIVRIREPMELYRQVCRISVREGDFRMAWIGLLDPETMVVRPAASYGSGKKYLEGLEIDINEASQGRLPISRAIREGKGFVCNDIENGTCLGPWRARALKFGFRSAAAFPLRVGKVVIGTLNLYASETDLFTEEEIGLIESLVEDISFAIEAIDNDRRRKEAEDSLRKAMSGLELKVEERTKELTGLLRERDSINRELNDFAYIVSHDLKAPLRAISALAGWIETDYRDRFDEEGREKLGLLVERVGRMHAFIDAILEYSRIGREKEERTLVDLNVLVKEISEMLLPPGNIGIVIEGELPSIRCEKTRIQQVFQNLMGNAIESIGRKRGKIRIGCRRSGGFHRFYVADNGCGIEEKHRERIFQMFQTLAPRDSHEGTGVGLAIVRKIVEMHGGSVEVNSRPGKGSTFRFTLPEEEFQ